MQEVFFHFREADQTEPDNEVLQVINMPRVGEVVTRHARSAWYRVVLVVHTPFEGTEQAGEVYAVKVDDNKALASWFSNAAWD